MKPLIIFILITISGINLFSQNDSSLKFIFVPHPRSEDQVHQSVLPAIEKIDFTKYDVRLLGGDITYSTSKDSLTLAYCNNLFNISSPNTLWGFGNHDVQSGNRSLIKKFTGRESFYSYTRDGVTFIVLDTELDATGFSRTFIKGTQLQMVKDVCDTISESNFLILLHSRFMWMINSEYFKPRLTDSIAASSRSMDTTNFYSDIYPLLQKVKNKGIQVLVFAGDKSKINVAYSPEDSITFYTARMAFDFPDSVNNVIVLDYDKLNKKITCNFVTLADMVTSAGQEPSQSPEGFVLYQNYPNPFNPETNFGFRIANLPAGRQGFGLVNLKVYDLLGNEIATVINKELPPGEYHFPFNISHFPLSSGVYFYRITAGAYTETKKMVLMR